MIRNPFGNCNPWLKRGLLIVEWNRIKLFGDGFVTGFSTNNGKTDKGMKERRKG